MRAAGEERGVGEGNADNRERRCGQSCYRIGTDEGKVLDITDMHLVSLVVGGPYPKFGCVPTCKRPA